MHIIPVALGFLGGSLFTYLIQRLVAYVTDRNSGIKIIGYMRSQIPKHYRWVSTNNIASSTNLTRANVEEICSKHPDILLSKGEKDGMWGLRESSMVGNSTKEG